jgi:hypothetical protein
MYSTHARTRADTHAPPPLPLTLTPHAVVAISPAGLDLKRITDLWDAAVASGKEGREAALAAALSALLMPPPPDTRAPEGAGRPETLRAAADEDGWTAFSATAAWWLGENANAVCDEWAGRVAPRPPGGCRPDAPPSEVLAAHSGRSEPLARVVAALRETALTAAWQLRVAAARAIATLAVRSGEPYRLQCYSTLLTLSGGGGDGDALGVRSITAPALALLDRVYSTQAVLQAQWAVHGDDVEGWPDDVIASLQRRAGELVRLAERHVCAVPRGQCSLLGRRAALVLAQGEEEEAYGSGFLGGGGGMERSTGTQDVSFFNCLLGGGGCVCVTACPGLPFVSVANAVRCSM